MDEYNIPTIREVERAMEEKSYCRSCGNETFGGITCADCWDEIEEEEDGSEAY